MRILGQHTKSASLPTAIDPLLDSSCAAYAPCTVFTRIASATLIRWFAPQVVPSQPVRVTIPWIPISGENGPGLKSDPAAARTPASSMVRNAMLRFMSASP